MSTDLVILISSSFVLFIIGLYGLLSKKDALKMIISIEIMVIAVNNVFLAIGYLSSNGTYHTYQSFAILSLAIGGIVISMALILLTDIYKNKDTIDVSKLNLLRW